ncbi:acyltransferase family protein [Paracoccus shandongensis]|uniref:acyltransferase family protein n=1 Tax=Paracoccus shandongensis TaxID=2816048 RepID=UPI001A8DAC06|nr:acyltransferase [Paracoccus shandongensis]
MSVLNADFAASDAGSRPAFRAYGDRRYFASLNGLRFLCIGAVLWHHSPANTLVTSPRLLERGFVGVDFFFVLSGFLITTLLLREERGTGRISLPGFYRRRALRILPAYVLLVTAMSAYWIGVKGYHDLAGMVPYYYAFLANFLKGDIPLLTITWSLSVEEQYYLLWPALLVVLPLAFRLRAGLLAVLIGLCLLAMLGLADWLDLPRLETAHAVFVLPGMSYMAILCGSLMALLLDDPAGFRWLWRLCGWRGAPLALFGALLLYLQLTPDSLLGWPALGMDVLMALCLASLVVREDHVLRPVLTLAPLARVGEISYGIYLYHLIGLHVANEGLARSGLAAPQAAWAVTLLYPLAAIAIAEASFRCLERPFLALKSGHAAGRGNPAPGR